MIGNRLTALLDWRPDAREKRLLFLLFAVAIGAWLYMAFDARQRALAQNAAAQQRLAATQAQFKLLSNNGWREKIVVQKRLLSQSIMVDATPAISQLRLHSEVAALTQGAGLSAPMIIGSPAAGYDDPVHRDQKGIAALTATVEFDFDWAGLLRLIEQVEYSSKGYFIDGFEVRQDGERRRMRVTFRTLYKKPGRAI